MSNESFVFGDRHPHILADQLTLPQPEGADYAHPLQWHPRIFKPSYGPALYLNNILASKPKVWYNRVTPRHRCARTE